MLEHETYEQYLAHLETLEGMARYPYTTLVENPPDTLHEYRRPYTREEYAKLKSTQELPVEVVLNALAQARELIGKCERSVRDQPDMFRDINDFLIMKVLNDSVRSSVIGLDGAMSVAHGKKYPRPPVVELPHGDPLPPASGPEHQAVLNEIDQTP